MLKKNFEIGLEKIAKEYNCDFSGINFSVISGDKMEILRQNNDVKITISKDVEFFRAVSFLLSGEKEVEVSERAKFDELSYMIDSSRNGVVRVDALCDFIMLLALNGFNQLMLYTEDTYPVEGEPYFGYMRGRYTENEIFAIEKECEIFGIELIPCIQTLSHLSAPLKWQAYGDITEYGDTLKVGNDKTYIFLDKCIKACRKIFKSDKIHIGMDEACLLAAMSQGKITQIDNKEQLFTEHLVAIDEICRRYNFTPMIWSDMLFKLEDKSYFDKSEVLTKMVEDKIPKNIELYYWNYYSDRYDNYDAQLKNHLLLNHKIKFAGGAWKWVGFAPYNKWSMATSEPAIKACEKNGINSVMCTAWGDYGDECSNFSVAPVMTLYAEMCYNFDNYESALKGRFANIMRAEFDSFLLLDIINETYVGRGDTAKLAVNNSCKYLLFGDLLNSFFDYNVVENVDIDYYKATIAELNQAKSSLGKYDYLAETLIKLAEVLLIKYDLSVKILRSYQSREYEKLAFIAKSVIPELIGKIKLFYTAFEYQWNMEKKHTGFDVQQLRFGALIFRLERVATLLQDFADKKITSIEELEEKRLPFSCGEDGKALKHILNNNMEKIVTANIM